MVDLHDILMRPLVVGIVDGTHSAEAVRLAWALSRRFGTPAELVHAIPSAGLAGVGIPGPDMLALDDERRRHVWGLIASELEEFDGPPAPLKDLLRVETGSPARALLRRAQAIDAGLIVIGPHHRHGILDFGSTARALMSHSPCPVWCQTGDGVAPKRLLVPVDLSEDSRHAVLVAERLAHHLGASIKVLHALELPAAVGPPSVNWGGAPGYVASLDEIEHCRVGAEAALEAFLAECPTEAVEISCELVDEPPVQAILDRQADTDLIVMGTQGRGKLSSAVLGSVAYAVMREAARPVLAVPHPADLEQRSRLLVDRFHVTA